MNNERNREFHVLSEDCGLPDEFPSIQEYIEQKDEFPSALASFPLSDEYQGSSCKQETAEEKHRSIKRMLFMPVASAVAAVSIVLASFENDPLGNDFLYSFSDPHFPHYEENHFTDRADKAFPVLSNLEPNGEVEGYGVLNEDFICIQSSSENLYLHADSAWGYYDENGEMISIEEFRQRHPISFASGVGGALELAHIVSRGADEIHRDCCWNTMMLTPEEHRKQHQVGWNEFLKIYPHLRGRVERARRIAGKLALLEAENGSVC